jgi:SAM-dependent methyltransferase
VSVRRGLKHVALRAPIPGRDRLAQIGWRGYEACLTRQYASATWPLEGPEAPPIPPPKLRVLVMASADPFLFIESGRAHSRFIRELLERHGRPIEELEAILDLGCGCGRLSRWWRDLPNTAVYGCDFNPELAGWCALKLPFMKTVCNELEPPLPFGPSRGFDFVCAWSLFTHLDGPLQHAWLEEIGAALAPGGRLLFTVSGAQYRDRLLRRDREAFDRGELVTHFKGAAGTNLCATYHPPTYVEQRMLQGFTLLEAVREQTPDFLVQDVYLARRD